MLPHKQNPPPSSTQGVEAGIDALNAVSPGLPRIYADQLIVGGEYSARRIRSVSSKFGDAYVLESDQFQMFLPKRYNQLTIEPYVEDRWFSLIEKGQLPDGRMIPIFKFFTRRTSDNPRNAAINPRTEKQVIGIVQQFLIPLSVITYRSIISPTVVSTNTKQFFLASTRCSRR